MYAGCNKYGVKLEVIPQILRLSFEDYRHHCGTALRIELPLNSCVPCNVHAGKIMHFPVITYCGAVSSCPCLSCVLGLHFITCSTPAFRPDSVFSQALTVLYKDFYFMDNVQQRGVLDRRPY